jgi:hypothetical protein
LAALAIWACACVVPVAPQFENPAENSPPYVASSIPAAGAVLPLSSNTIEVTLGDPNLEDILSVRWLIDYPPYDVSVSRMAPEVRLPPSEVANREPIRFAPSCAENQIPPGLASHRVTLSVADRPFLPPEEALAGLPWDSVSDVGFVLRTTWIVNLACP